MTATVQRPSAGSFAGGVQGHCRRVCSVIAWGAGRFVGSLQGSNEDHLQGHCRGVTTIVTARVTVTATITATTPETWSPHGKVSETIGESDALYLFHTFGPQRI